MATFGAALKRTREQRGVSLDEIARETRLSKRYLLAIEDEAIAKLPGGTYNRAYLRSYAAFLGLDAEALLRDYAQEESRQTQAAEADQLAAMNRAIDRRGVSASGAQAGLTRAREALSSMNRVPLLAVLALTVLAGAAWFGLSGFPQASTGLEIAAVEHGGGSGARPEPPIASAAPSAEPAAPTSPASASPIPASPAADTGASAPAAVGPSDAPAEAAGSVPPSSPPTPADVPSSTAPVESEVVQQRPAAAFEGLPPADAPGDVADPRGLSRLTVAGSGVGTGVVERELVGQADRFMVGSKVVFWTHVRGGRAGDTIDHVWFRDGTLVGAASLMVGSPDWRTQSRRLLDPSGVWVVEARDAEGHVLARHEFQAAP